MNCLEGFLTLVITKNEDYFAFRIDTISAGQSGCFSYGYLHPLLDVILLLSEPIPGECQFINNTYKIYIRCYSKNEDY